MLISVLLDERKNNRNTGLYECGDTVDRPGVANKVQLSK